MPYGNYNFVIDSSFRPFSFQEMLQPWVIYGNAYKEVEDEANDLVDKSDAFKYLSETLPEGSKARKIYEGYANDLKVQAEDLARNGLSMNNRRALTGLKRRYNGEIGRLVKADEALRKEMELRRNMSAKDSSMMYALDNLNIDDYLDGNMPNTYSISGNELYARGAQAGKSASSRIYEAGDEGSTLGGYYRKWVERNGYSKESMDAFRANAASIPELQLAADNILAERGVNENLTGVNLERARQSVLNGIIDGAVYQEKVNPVRDVAVQTPAERAATQMAKEKWDMEKRDWEDRRNLMYEYEKDAEGNVMVDENNLPIVKGLNKEYMSDNYEVDPTTGKLRKKKADTTTSKEERAAKALEDKATTALLALNKDPKVFKNDEGFDVAVGTENRHYSYIGAIDNHGGEWYTGKMGEDVPKRGLGFTSASNVMSPWGNYSSEYIDDAEKDKTKLLAENEIVALQNSNPYFTAYIKERLETFLKENNLPENTQLDWQIIQVPNEHGGSRNGYLVAVRTV